LGSSLERPRFAGIIDSQATIASGSRCVIYIWYDNEFGYSTQVVRLMNQMAGIAYPTLPAARH
jgi:glyceraldehyde 3-phosphate dehydrogenase